MSVSYEAFFPEVLPFVRDVPEIVALQAVRNAAIEFCERSQFLQASLDPQPIIAGVTDYELDPDTGYRIVEILEAWNDSQLLIPKSIEELTRIYRSTNWQTISGNPYYFYRESQNVMRLAPTPQTTVANALRVRVAIAPTRASTTIADDVFERWLEHIAVGARARLYDTPNQPYHDPKAAILYTKRFVDACANVRRLVNKGDVRAASQVEFQRWT
jgi:hypothetical protein